MGKPVIRWKPVPQQDPSDRTKMVTVPTIVERTEPIDLTQLAYNAIDTGRIAGLKTSAAESIGRGLAEQIGQTLAAGMGLKFGDYFYVRPYLSGTIATANSPLNPTANKINVRLMPGEGLRLSNADFSFRNVLETGDAPVIDNLTNSSSTQEPDQIVKSQGIRAQGSYLKVGADDVCKFVWENDGDREEAVVTPSVNTNSTLDFAWPAALSDLDAGTIVTLEITYTRVIEGQTATFFASRSAVLVAA